MSTLILIIGFLALCFSTFIVVHLVGVKTMLLISSFLFIILLIYYSVLTIAGLIYRSNSKKFQIKSNQDITQYPSVDILIPAHNEGVVIKDTLSAMAKINYQGKLTVYLLNDNSSDETGEIAEEFDKAYYHIKHIKVPPGEPKGKSRVLNYGLSISDGEYFCIYDADNQPEPGALTLLVEAALYTKDAAGAVGYVKTMNEQKNWLTRMISIEFQVFQLLMQSGRWLLFKTGSLTGTNMLVKRSVIEQLGGYDVYAIAEDAELTLRITQSGYLLPIVPQSVTWEQEPETLGVYIKQRTRWLQGNLYILEKVFSTPSYWTGKLIVHSLHQLLVYVVFWVFLVLSYGWFILGLFGFMKIEYSLPLLFMWYVAYTVYTCQLFSAQISEETNKPINILSALIMYFTYAQLFTYLFVRSLLLYIKARINNKTIGWDKTTRFKTQK
ncbi:glycosyltransferase family 2 protein [Gottfriedia solisilvae]|uniref:N-acetylglucosaminyltransferase n=1 Tax=Gottfriedia solisilvae TaxID=1516104 RepID=A0A8J3AVN2_9BACI|nr:glycosyltransferase [Gottfriedia solisilvae]GGI17717.1 N-acetylglucosaminyltransferase [Gottfriedia solisilvae]